MIREEDVLTSYRADRTAFRSRLYDPRPLPGRACDRGSDVGGRIVRHPGDLLRGIGRRTAGRTWSLGGRTARRAADLTAERILLGLAVSFLLGVMGGPAAARDGDGTLLLTWTGEAAISAGTSRIIANAIPAGELVVAVIGSGRERTVSLAQAQPADVRDLDPGFVRIELRHGMGLLAVWEIVVRREVSTLVGLDLASGSLSTSAASPEPFGSWESWSPTEIVALPGLAQEGIDDVDTRTAVPQDYVIDGLGVERHDRLRPGSFGLDAAIIGAQRPLGSEPAYRRGGLGLRLLTRPLPGRNVRIGGSGGNGGRYLGHVELRDRYQRVDGSALDFGGQVQFSAFDVAGPLEALNASLDHDDETALELRARASYDQPGSRLRFDLYAQGSERNYYANEFEENVDHAPREDHGALAGALAWDLRLGAQDVSLEARAARSYSETGDGRAFDDFSGYNRSNSLPEVQDDGLFWYGDDPMTPTDEGKLFDYYARSLVEEIGLRADFSRDLVVPRGLRAGFDLGLSRWHAYEHLRPSRVVASGEAGYLGLTRNFGYTQDGDERADDSGHLARSPRQVALFASQRLEVGAASLEAGLRWDQFAPGQNPIADRRDPLGADNGSSDPAAIEPSDLRARPVHDQVEPRLGLYLPLGTQNHLWVDGGRRQIVPPYEAVYYDEELLEREAGLADDASDRLAAAYIHGNPDLAPADEWSGQLGFLHERATGFALRLAAYGARTSDTWVARRYARTRGTLDVYENGGERRELGLHLGLDLGAAARSRLRVQYDLSRTETDVIEPLPLYADLRYEGLPVTNAASPQTRLRSVHWIDDGADRGFFPSLFDRRHRLAVHWSRQIAEFGTSNEGRRVPRLGLSLLAASGAPYTKTFVRAEGDLEESTDPTSTTDPSRWTGDVHDERLPATWQIDFVYIQPLTVLSRLIDLRIEVRNLTDHQNAQYVHPATGEADDDGWLDTAAGQAAIQANGDGFATDYEKAIESPSHYTEGLTARVALTAAIF